MDSGAFAMMMGEDGLFEEMTERTEKLIEEKGIKTIICVSPHDYDAFKAYYPAFEGLEIKHYTQVFDELLAAGKLKLSKSIDKKNRISRPVLSGAQERYLRRATKCSEAYSRGRTGGDGKK